ncbi:serine protease inhibitor 42Dd [Drosophila nasuta]|uniref:Serine protease inhibitor 42Dd n=1 Tax=Drosophila albomicans TaxID=7291 RepID=A0A6P8XAM0_DROAB|nr:serine protease inhibitor 42Dd [Drosophila albomicans]XP_060652261.1 serine protease inhibitor 42Dd [Drosophila nasuta]
MFDFNLEFARGGATFTTELFQLLSAGGVSKNIVFSPFSIQTCIALAFAGAQGETADEIATGLRFVSNFPPEVAQTFQFVLEKYRNSNLLKIANKLYVQQGKQLKADYEQSIKEQYNSEAESINFALSDAAAQSINAWVNAKTEGKITELVTPDAFSDNTRLVLLNALHFKGSWANKFLEERTEEDDFWVGAEETVKVPYMNQKAKFGYGFFDDLGCTAIDMPYKDSDLSMFVLLPQEREGLKDLAEKLKSVNLVDLADKLVVEEVHVKFPKFKVDYSIELADKLKQLGISKMFDEGAEFNNLLESPEGVFVSKVLHKATIEVNEEGTEAAAATGMIMMTRMMTFPLQFQADRPFLYVIWNKKNILFAGAFVNAPDA